MSDWTIKGGTTITDWTAAAALRISNVRRTLVAQTPDTVTFDIPGNMLDADLFAYRDIVEIRKDDVPWFYGVVVQIPSRGDSREEAVSYVLQGGWYWFRAMYTQLWMVYVPGTGLTQVEKTRAILCQNASGTRITTGAQILAAVQRAIAAGAPISAGTISTGITVPMEAVVDLTCGDVIQRMLRWTPDVNCWFDYSIGAPVFHCVDHAGRPTKTITVGTGGDPVTAVGPITPRYDLQLPGVKLIFEKRTYTSGLPGGDTVCEAIDTQTAGDDTDIEALVSTIELAGVRVSYLSQRIETEDWPEEADLNGKAFWKALRPELQAFADGEITIRNATRSGTLPRILTEGALQDWMEDFDDGEGDPLTVEQETITCDVVTAVNGNTVVNTITHSVQSTNASTRTYWKLEEADFGEVIPSDMAANLYAAWNRLQYDGTIVLADSECSSGVHPGMRLSIAGLRTEWTSMGATVQQVQELVDSGQTQITIGPTKHLGPDDLRTLLRTFRTKVVPRLFKVRTTGASEDDAGALDLSGPGPLNNGGGVPTEFNKLQVTSRDESLVETGSVELDPSSADFLEHKVLTVQEVGGLPVMKPGWVRAHD